MNDPLPPLTDDDLSAHLDGEAGPDLVARLEADPGARARLDQLRAAADVVRDASVAPLEAAVARELVDRALAATELTSTGSPVPGDPVVVPLAGRRRAGQQWLVAAVILVLVAAGLALVWSGTRDSTADDTASRASTADGAAPGRAEGTETPSAGGGGDAGTAAATDQGADLPDLGAFETSDELRSSLATAFPADAEPYTSDTDTEPITDTSVDRCAGLLREVLPVQGDPTHTGVARVGGETVLVYEFTATPERGTTTSTAGSPGAGAPATTLTTAVRPEACDPLFVFQR